MKNDVVLYPYVFTLSILPYSLWLFLSTDYIILTAVSLSFIYFWAIHIIRFFIIKTPIPHIQLLPIVLLFSLLLGITNLGDKHNTPQTYKDISIHDERDIRLLQSFSENNSTVLSIKDYFKLGSGQDIAKELIYKKSDILQYLTEKKAQVSFKKDMYVDEVCYFSGISDSLDMIILAKTDRATVSPIAIYENEYSKIFQWVCTTFPTIKTDTLYFISKTTGQQQIGEVRAYLKNKRIPLHSSFEKMSDEKEISKPNRTGYMNTMVFDEIYHARSAFEFKEGLVVYEDTHPPLGKNIIQFGIYMSGFSPFGWRIMSVCFSILSLLFAYSLLYKMTRSRMYGVMTVILLSSSWLHLVQSRFGLIDIFSTSFLMGVFLFLFLFLEKSRIVFLYLSSIFLGLSVGVKWSALFASLGILLISIIYLIKIRKENKPWVKLFIHGIIAYVIVFPIVYICTFYDYIFLRGFSLMDVINYNLFAYDYHALETSTHPSSSLWWEWVINSRTLPIFMQEDSLGSAMIFLSESSIVSLFSVLSILILIYLAIYKKTAKYLFLPLAYLSLLLPYLFIGRTLYFYHYSYSLFFAIISIVYVFSLWSEKKKKRNIIFFMSFLFVGYVQLLMLYNYSEITGQTYPGKTKNMNTEFLIEKGFNDNKENTLNHNPL